MARDVVKRSPVVHIILFILFLLPLFFVKTQRSIAQTPYPTNTPIPDDCTLAGGTCSRSCGMLTVEVPAICTNPADKCCMPVSQCQWNGGFCYAFSYNCAANGKTVIPGWSCDDPATEKCCVVSTPTPTPIPATPTVDASFYCPGGAQAALCYQTSDCNCGVGVSATCQGVTYPVTSGDDCGNCYCTSTDVTPGSCTDPGACEYINSTYGWCQWMFCDTSCTCSIANPGCCSGQIVCPCQTPTIPGTTAAPTNTPGGLTNTPTRTPTATRTPTLTPTSTPGCGPRWYCDDTVFLCNQTAENFDTTTGLNCPGGTYNCSTGYTPYTCYANLSGCQAACVTPTYTPSPTITPGGPSLTPTSTTGPLDCRVQGIKYIEDVVAGVGGLCDDPADACAPAINQGIAFHDTNPLPASFLFNQSANPYSEILDADIDSNAYRETPDTLTGFTTAYVYNSGGKTSAASKSFWCPAVPPALPQELDWYFIPNTGTINVRAKEVATAACDPNIANMNALTDLAGVELELFRNDWNGLPVSSNQLKSYAFDNGNPATYRKAAPDSFPDVVIPHFTHSLSDANVPAGWTMSQVCWYDAGGAWRASGNSMTDGGTGLWYGGSALTAFVLYLAPDSWVQTAGGDVYAAGNITTKIPPGAVNPFLSLDFPVGGLPGFITYGGGTFDIHPDPAYTGIDPFPPFTYNLVSSTRWLVNNSIAPTSWYSRLVTSIGGDPGSNTMTLAGPMIESDLSAANCPEGVCFTDGAVATNNVPWNISGKYIVVVRGPGASLTINNQINLPAGSFIAFLVDGNIRISDSLGDGALYPAGNPELEGLYVASGMMDFPTAGASNDRQLWGRGFFAANTFTFDRSMGLANATDPAQVFTFDPSLIFTMPKSLWQTVVAQEEIAPIFTP